MAKTAKAKRPNPAPINIHARLLERKAAKWRGFKPPAAGENGGEKVFHCSGGMASLES